MRGDDRVGLIIMALRFLIELLSRCGKACVKPFKSTSEEEDEDNNQPNS